ncbi:NAD(P)-binding protein [Annulohypoxylon maeteangense]|uniref:NAD(P)-binding protein n=1 Tax=Annulohypoxylon maeteangense TaxID=1927788 RepID=UPI0020078A01|nr:NAD(P)-binding protein [Annulohypoxylon maeteangense]KAI0879963.1 NAD(P)-binding protein [Annulohypoxylon maeteangense]
MATTFDISPEKRAGQLHYYYRQLFVTPQPVLRRNAGLSGKTAIVTGSNSGIGLEIAGQLVDLGCSVILAVRDESRGEKARQELNSTRNIPPDIVQVWKLDISSYDSISTFISRVKGLENLDIAILNAGVYKFTESFSSTGYEESVQINYLSNILLMILLLPIIKEKRIGSAPGQICLVSSDAAAWSKFEERSSSHLLSAFTTKMANWNMADRYATSKLLGQLFITELAKHVPPSVVTLTAANPGFCNGSGLGREFHGIIYLIVMIQFFFLSRTCAVGARTIVHAVSSFGEQAHGQYIEDAKIQPMPPIIYKPEGLRLAKQLYEETLDELSFAGLRDIINQVSKTK